MQRPFLNGIVSLLVGVGIFTVTGIAAGCSSGGDTGVAPAAQNEMKELGDAARKAGGDYDKLTEAQKQKFLDRVGGNEAQARQMVTQISGGGGARGGGKAPATSTSSDPGVAN